MKPMILRKELRAYISPDHDSPARQGAGMPYADCAGILDPMLGQECHLAGLSILDHGINKSRCQVGGVAEGLACLHLSFPCCVYELGHFQPVFPFTCLCRGTGGDNSNVFADCQPCQHLRLLVKMLICGLL